HVQDHEYPGPRAHRTDARLVLPQPSVDRRRCGHPGSVGCTRACPGLGTASSAGVVGAVRGAAPADHGDAVPGAGAHRLPGGTTRPDGGTARPNRLAAHCAVLGGRHELQGGFGAAACLCAGTGTDGSPVPGHRSEADARAATGLRSGHARRSRALPAVCRPALLDLGAVWRPGLLDGGAAVDRSARAVHLSMADPAAAPPAYAVLL